MDHALGGDRMPFQIASLVRATLDARPRKQNGGPLPAALFSLDAPGRARA